MIFGLFRRRNPNADIVDRLYTAVADASRRPAFYRDLAVPDTVEGRFELMVLHVVLVLRRLHALPPPADDLARDLVDATFAQFDSALRELGVSDIGVPKRMKDLAGAFYGRAKAYEAAFGEGRAALESALLRNVYAGSPEREGAARRLATYVEAAGTALEGASFDDFTAGRLPFPEADPFTREDVP
jgi:cytochrome b pre-mRNA-processing protein 3